MKKVWIGYSKDGNVDNIKKYINGDALWYIEKNNNEVFELERLIVELKDLNSVGEVNIVINGVNELSDNKIKCELILHKFAIYNARVFDIFGKDLTLLSDSNKFLRELLNELSKFESELVIARLRIGREIAKKSSLDSGGSGKVTGRRSLESMCPDIIEDIIWLDKYGRRQLFPKTAGRLYTPSHIAKILNDMCYKTTGGDDWNYHSVLSVLKKVGRKK